MTPLVSTEVLAQLRRTVYDHIAGIVAVNFGPDLIDPADLERLVIEGVISPDDARALHGTPLQDAFVTGAVIQRLQDAGRRSQDITQRQLEEELQRNPLPLGAAGQRALDWCRAGAAIHCRHLGDRLVAGVEGAVWQHFDDLREQDAESIRVATGDAIAGKRSRNWLASELREKLGDAAGDLRRIAATEVQDARNEGAASYLLDKHGPKELVVKIPNPGACSTCIKLYMDGENPRVFELAELVANGTNQGRKRADWKPVVGTTHPWCACDLRRLPPGFHYVGGELKVIGSP